MLILLLASFSLQATVKDMERLYAEQRYQEAYQLGFKHLAEEAGNPNFDMIFGVAAQKSGELDQALFAFERVLMYDSKTQVARFELARTHFLLDNHITARHNFNRLLTADPQPPSEAMKRVQWYLAAIDAKESGQAIASSDAVTRYHLGVRYGFDSNPRNSTYHSKVETTLGSLPIDDLESDTFHDIYAGVNRFQQQGESWGWFMGGNASLRGYHDDQDDMDNYSLGAQAGGIILGKTWRLSLPLQASWQARDDQDKNKVLVLAIGTEFNHRLTAKADYTLFGQLAAIDYTPTNNRDSKSYTGGLIFSYRTSDQVKIYLGPVLGKEKADKKAGEKHGRDFYGLRTGLGQALTNRQRLDYNLSYLNSEHQAAEPFFNNKIRKDHQIHLGVKYSYQFPKDWLLDLGVQHSYHDSNINLYSYHRTQVSAGVRKEW